MKKWQLQEAKAKLSEVVKDATNKGPQQITIRGRATAIILSAEEYNQLISPKTSFVKFLHNSPLCGISIDLERDKSLCRNVEL